MDTTGGKTPITLHHSMNQKNRKALSTGKTQDPQHSNKENDKGSKNKGGQNKSNEEYGTDREKKTMSKVYDLNSDEDLN